jgi:hypothetical protein
MISIIKAHLFGGEYGLREVVAKRDSIGKFFFSQIKKEKAQ